MALLSARSLRPLRYKWSPLLTMAVFAPLLIGCQDESGPKAKLPPIVRTLDAAPVDREETAMVTGEIEAATSSDLSFRVAGRVREWFVDIASRVQAGDVLAELDATEPEADLDAARAALASAQTRLTIVRSAFARQKALLANGYTTRGAYDQAQENLLLAQGDLTSARARLDIAREAVAYTVLRAPMAGTITARQIEAGQVVEAAQTAFRLATDSQRSAIFDLNEAGLAGIKPGSRLTVALISDPSVQASGEVREIAPVIDAQSATVRIKVALDGASQAMSLGSPVAGTIRRSRSPRFELPWSALTAIGADPAVWVVDPTTDTVSRRPIRIGTYESGRFSVLSGIRIGDRVVTDGTKLLNPGQKVVLATEESGS